MLMTTSGREWVGEGRLILLWENRWNFHVRGSRKRDMQGTERAVEVESKSTGLHRHSLLFLICMWILSTGSEVYGTVQFCTSKQKYLTFRDSTLCTFAIGCTSSSLQKHTDSVSNIAGLLAEGSGLQSRLNPAIPNGLIVVGLSHAKSQITSVHFRT